MNSENKKNFSQRWLQLNSTGITWKTKNWKYIANHASHNFKN